LADSRSICAAADIATQTTHWVICRIEEIAGEQPTCPTITTGWSTRPPMSRADRSSGALDGQAVEGDRSREEQRVER
jgi:hypothetical protein